MKHTLLFTAAAVLSAALAVPAQAQLETFGQYSVTNTTGSNPYTFTNLANGSTLMAFNVPVTFVYNVPNGYGAAGTNIAATLTLSETVSHTATSTNIAPYNLTYLFQPVHFVNLSLTANGTGATLLSLTQSSGSISGFSGGTTASNSGDTLAGGTGSGDTVNFSSDYLNFAASTQRDYNLSMTSVLPGLTLNDNGYLNSFTANGNAAFASDGLTPAPEPSGLISFVVMGGGLALCAARRRTSSC